jgi:ABC-type nitrate/sulfonate/bicarbonate transport system substrate-binding protein
MSTYDTIWYTRCPVPTATGIAADLGWLTAEFAPDGIEVRSLQDVSRAEAADFHYTHAHPGLFREGGNVPALWARSRGEETRLIGLTWIEERQVIHVRDDSPVVEPGQLKGLRLAIPRHDIAIDFWRAMALHGFGGALGVAGLTLDDAELVEVRAGQVAGQWEAEFAALASGEVDAVYTKGAVALETAKRYPSRIAVELDEVPDRRFRVNNGTPRPITVHQRLLDERPDIAVRFLSVLVRAANWAAGNPDETARILAAETGSGPAGVTGAYTRASRFRDLHADLSPERLDLLSEQEHFLRTHGFLGSPVQVPTWADGAPLRAALQENPR